MRSGDGEPYSRKINSAMVGAYKNVRALVVDTGANTVPQAPTIVYPLRTGSLFESVAVKCTE